MTVSVLSASSGPFYPNGVTLSFPFDFKIAAKDEIAVTRVSALGAVSDVPAADYSVTIAVDGEGGSVDFVVAPLAAAGALFILSAPSFGQEILFEDEGPFNASIMNPVADRAAIRDLWLRDRSLRSLIVPPGEATPKMRSLVGADGKVLGVVDGEIVPVPPADVQGIAALNAATAALTAANAALSQIGGRYATVKRYGPQGRRWTTPSGMLNPLGLSLDCDGAKYAFSSDPFERNDWTNSASGITHLYVAPRAGLDSNPGTTATQPWKSLDKVVSSAPDKAIIHFVEPECDYNAALAGTYNFGLRRIKIVSDVSIGTIFTGWRFNYNLEFLNWQKEGTAYYTDAAVNSGAINSMFDRKYLDLYGLGMAVPALGSSAAVKATPGSWYRDAGTGRLWVRLIDDRIPDPANGWTPVTGFGGWNFLTDAELVMDNLHFAFNSGGANASALRIRPTTAFVTNDAKVSLRNVRAFGADGNAIQVMDFDTTVLQKCVGSECLFDIFNYSSFMGALGARDQMVYEDRCHGHNAGSQIGKILLNQSNSNNISTGHSGKHIMRNGLTGYGCPNSFVADVHGCYSMNAAVVATESTGGVSGKFLNNYWNQREAGQGSTGAKMILLGCDGEALSAGRYVFSNYDDSDTIATLGEIHLADWLGTPSAATRPGTQMRDYVTGAAL